MSDRVRHLNLTSFRLQDNSERYYHCFTEEETGDLLKVLQITKQKTHL